MKQIHQGVRIIVCALAIAVFATAPVEGDVTEWLAEVGSGTSAGYTNTGISGASPITDDIGIYDETTNGGITYEFLVNANNGGISSALMGSLMSPPVGDSAGLKFEQWPNTGRYGVTIFGVLDYTSSFPHILNEDQHVVFVNDGTDTDIYINGTFAEKFTFLSPTLSGVTGIGATYRHSDGTFIDPLDGTLLGVAVYDAALTADEIATHYNAFTPIPAPSSLILLSLGLGAMSRKRRE